MNHFNRNWAGCLRWLLGAVLWAACAGTAFAADPDKVTVSHKICNLPDDTTLPDANGQFVCADADYSGNAGKNWNELDLVPIRLELTATNSAPANQTYTLAIVVDREDVSRPGYDFLSLPILNTVKSDPGCLAPINVGAQTLLSPGSGGADVQLYRLVTFAQAKGTSCVYDYYGRLALGSHLYPGASLHANVLAEDLTSSGNQERSIPVNEISPQEMSKSMTASQNAERAWNVTKNATPGNLDFGDVCKAPAGALEKEVQVTVTWSKLAATPSGDVTVVTNINVKNPAARTITVNVTDSIYAGQTKAGAALATQSTPAAGIDVAANFNGVLTTFTYTLPSALAGNVGAYLNDEAVATYTDKITGVAVPGNVVATAKAQIQTGTTLNETANIADLETITGTGLSFKVAAPSMGNFADIVIPGDPVIPAYIPGALATKVAWEIGSLNADGSVTFVKKIVLDQPRITTGELTDVATLVSTDSNFTAGATLFPVSISSSATVSLKVSKTIPIALKAGESVVVNFNVTLSTGGAATQVTVTFTGPSAIGASAESAPLSGLPPASYTVTEVGSTFYDAANPLGVPLNIVPVTGQQPLDLSPKAGGIMDASNCSGTVNFVNTIPGSEFPTAKVAKITQPALLSSDPDSAWTFTLSGPGNFESDTVVANAGQGFSTFSSSLTEEGTYTVTETLRAGWDQAGVILPDGSSASTLCTFTVDFPGDFGKSFECTFTNKQRGHVKVIKTLNGQPLTNEQFTFQLRKDATGTAEGTALETLTTHNGGSGGTLNFATLLVPNSSYQMCEATPVGWTTNFNDPNSLFVPGAFLPPGGTVPNPGVDNSWLCVNFTVAPGETKTFNVDNLPPPGGRALTIGFWKNHASCASSSAKKNNATKLDETLYASSGILRRSQIDSLVYADHTTFGLYGQSATSTADCPYAVSLLDKRNFSGAKKASDPLFNMAAQLVAVELNLAAGAYTCQAVVNAVTTAEGLLAKYAFTGFGYTGSVSKDDAKLANTTAAKLDDYNNNRAGVCP